MDEEGLEKVIAALSYGKRRTLIIRLGEAGPLSVKELKRDLGLSTGSLYHNLLALGELIEQTTDKKYVLSEQGKKVYLALKSGLIPSSTSEELPKVFETLVPVRVFSEMPSWMMLPTATLILLSLSASSLYARMGLSLLIPIMNVRFSSTLGSVVLSLLLIYLAPKLVFKGRRVETGFITALPFCFTPQLAYVWIMVLFQPTNPFSSLLQFLSGGLSALLLSAAIVCWFKASPQAALLTSFLILYFGAAMQPFVF
ncbi:MAG: helix-turn-helix transcriptional regulator [Thermoproteota archaeon]